MLNDQRFRTVRVTGTVCTGFDQRRCPDKVAVELSKFKTIYLGHVISTMTITGREKGTVTWNRGSFLAGPCGAPNCSLAALGLRRRNAQLTLMDDIESGSFQSNLEEIHLLAGVRFRVLIVGRANAGKTTILERLCNDSVDKAQVYRDGELTGVRVKKGEPGRGEHLITDEIVFPSNPGFVFHDSCGFESGSDRETLAVASFIRQRAELAQDLKSLDEAKANTDILHAIWVCIPLDNDRPLQDAELAVFGNNPGKVPVLVIFTKRDGRFIKEFAKLCDALVDPTRASRKEARGRADEVVDLFVESLQVKLKGQPYPPADFIVTTNMNKTDETTQSYCNSLIQSTRGKLFDIRLETLLVIVQHNNFSDRMEYAFRWLLHYIAVNGMGIVPTLKIPRLLQIISYFLPIRAADYDDLLDDYNLDYLLLERDYLRYDYDMPPAEPLEVYGPLASVFQPFTMRLGKENFLTLLTSCASAIMIVRKITLEGPSSTEMGSRAAGLVHSLSVVGEETVQGAVQVKCSYTQFYLARLHLGNWDRMVEQMAKDLAKIVEENLRLLD